MKGLFGFADMYGTYESRKVGRLDTEDGVSVSTARVTDSDKPYETAVMHPRYKKDEWIIVECYDTKAEAKEGHEKWVKTMTSKTLPATLMDVSTAQAAQLLDALDKDWRGKKKAK